MLLKKTAIALTMLAMGVGTLGVQADGDSVAVENRLRELEQANAANRALIQQLQKDNASQRARLDENYLENRRGEDVQAMVTGVLEDAETRRSLSASGAVAGHDGKFFLASADGKFRLNISGKLVFRYYLNAREHVTTGGATAGNHDLQHGFEARDIEVGFTGHVFDPDLGYGIVLESNANSNFNPEAIWISYAGFFEGLTVYLNYGKEADYDLENATSSTKQNAVERSYTSRRLNLDGGNSVTGLTAKYASEYFRVNLSFMNMDSTAWSVNSGYVLNGRVEVKLMGTWKQYGDLSSWSGEEAMLVIGGGFAYAYSTDAGSYRGDGATTDDDWTEFGWAVDARFEWNGLSVWISGIGQHGQTTGPGASFDIYGVIGAVAYNIMDTVEIFVRGEGIINSNQYAGAGFSRWDRDGGVAIVTVGGTWFIYKDKLKLTLDVGLATDNINDADTSAGVLDSDNGGDDSMQVIVRAQVQLKY